MSEKILLEYVDEKTFEKSNIEYDTELVRLADQVNTMVERGGRNLMSVTPVFAEPSGKQLRFTINKGKNRVEREMGKHLYKVTIEKLEPKEMPTCRICGNTDRVEPSGEHGSVHCKNCGNYWLPSKL